MYICPKCACLLTRQENSYKCPQGHSYDISSSGYVNLILSGKKSASHGDNKEMIAARKQFLNLGFYSTIPKCLSEIISSLKSQKTSTKLTILDAGCGEGYYTDSLYKLLNNSNIPCEIYGIDVSKDAVISAAKRCKNAEFAVASVNSLPFADQSFDFVLSLFAPLAENEFHRVLKKGGVLITVSPSPRHLYGLKEEIYDTPYLNPVTTFDPEILTKTDERIISDNIHLSSNLDIINLFKMTPYYYNTGKKDAEKLNSLTELDTEIGFVFGVYTKKL